MIFALSATLSGALAGTILGGLGQELPVSIRVSLSSSLALVAVGIGGVTLLGLRLKPIQRQCETPKSWVFAGPLRWAAWNGAALGVGATTRIGFWLWYVTPISAFLIGQPILGAALYGTYGFTRAASSGVLLLSQPRWIRADDLGLWMISQATLARHLSAAYMVAGGLIVAIIVGL